MGYFKFYSFEFKLLLFMTYLPRVSSRKHQNYRKMCLFSFLLLQNNISAICYTIHLNCFIPIHLCVQFSFLAQRDGIFFISGDVHFGEITRCDCVTGYPLYDITSSGLTQAVEQAVPPPLHFLVRFISWLTPSSMRVMDKSCRFRSCTYGMLFCFSQHFLS